MSLTAGAEIHVTIRRTVAESSRKVPMWWKKPVRAILFDLAFKTTCVVSSLLICLCLGMVVCFVLCLILCPTGRTWSCDQDRRRANVGEQCSHLL